MQSALYTNVTVNRRKPRFTAEIQFTVNRGFPRLDIKTVNRGKMR